MKQMNVGIFIYDQAEVLDFSGPFEVFSTASRLCRPAAPFNVFLVGETGRTVAARGGFSVNPACGFADHPPVDVLVVAGGVHTGEMKKINVVDWLARTAADAKLVASVCTGAFLLAAARIITCHNVTTHWEDIDDLRRGFPDLIVHESRRWVDEGHIVTSGGISAGIDMSLHLVAKLHGLALAERTARQMEFEWTQGAYDAG